MKSENRILRSESGKRLSPIVAPAANTSMSGLFAKGKQASKRERQRKAVLNVLKLWSAGELSRKAPGSE
jgi:hypothetical protein